MLIKNFPTFNVNSKIKNVVNLFLTCLCAHILLSSVNGLPIILESISVTSLKFLNKCSFERFATNVAVSAFSIPASFRTTS